MEDYDKIMEYIMREIHYLKSKDMEIKRIILGIDIVNLISHKFDYYINVERENYSFNQYLFMGYPVTIDYGNKKLIMVCHGNEWEFNI